MFLKPPISTFAFTFDGSEEVCVCVYVCACARALLFVDENFLFFCLHFIFFLLACFVFIITLTGVGRLRWTEREGGGVCGWVC